MARLIVTDGTRAVVRLDGRVATVLEPGRHRLPGRWWWRRSVHVVDIRDRALVITGQELSAANLPGLKVSAALGWRIVDPVAWLGVSVDPTEEIRLALQVAVRDWAASAPADVLVTGRAAAAAGLMAAVAPTAHRVGADVGSAVIRDVVVPGELRRAALAVVTARLDGQAALERARGETAALRAAANGARLLADHPALLQLRTVEAASAGGGQVVLRVGRDDAPPA